MGPEASVPQTPRVQREHATTQPPVGDASRPVLDDAPADVVAAEAARHPLALAWVEESTVGAPLAPDSLTVSSAPPDAGADLLASVPRRRVRRTSVLTPALVLVALAGAYAAATLLWPLGAVAPRVEPVGVQPVTAAAAAPAWPTDGGAALSVAGFGGPLSSSSSDAVSIASITKLVTALVVLDELPLAPGEQGPEFAFTPNDRTQYWADRANGESALDVPVGGSLTQYQMLEGLLIGSANNYADRLSDAVFPSDSVFADAARDWLASHGITGITIVDPSGIVAGNRATPESLIPLAETALENPVIAEIVAKQSIDLPGAGHVENTNDLLTDPGVVGLKTGTLDAYNLLAAKDVAVGPTTVRIFGSVLGQPDRGTRDAAMRALFAQTEQELQPRPSVVAGTVVGRAVTRWGDPVDVVTAADAEVVLWNGAVSSAGAQFSLDDQSEQGATVGTLTVTGPVDTDTVEVRLAGEIEPPSPLWRLSHPLELFGLA